MTALQSEIGAARQIVEEVEEIGWADAPRKLQIEYAFALAMSLYRITGYTIHTPDGRRRWNVYGKDGQHRVLTTAEAEAWAAGFFAGLG